MQKKKTCGSSRIHIRRLYLMWGEFNFKVMTWISLTPIIWIFYEPVEDRVMTFIFETLIKWYLIILDKWKWEWNVWKQFRTLNNCLMIFEWTRLKKNMRRLPMAAITTFYHTFSTQKNKQSLRTGINISESQFTSVTKLVTYFIRK